MEISIGFIIPQQSEDQKGMPVSCFQNQKTINYHYIRTINVVVKKQNQTEFLSQSIFLTKILNSLRALDLLDFYIKRNLEVNIRKFAAGKLNLNPSIQPNNLVYKSSCLYVLVLPQWHHLMLWHIRSRLFKAIVFFDNHDKYVEFLDIFYNNFISSI